MIAFLYNTLSTKNTYMWWEIFAQAAGINNAKRISRRTQRSVLAGLPLQVSQNLPPSVSFKKDFYFLATLVFFACSNLSCWCGNSKTTDFLFKIAPPVLCNTRWLWYSGWPYIADYCILWGFSPSKNFRWRHGLELFSLLFLLSLL